MTSFSLRLFLVKKGKERGEDTEAESIFSALPIRAQIFPRTTIAPKKPRCDIQSIKMDAQKRPSSTVPFNPVDRSNEIYQKHALNRARARAFGRFISCKKKKI